MKFRTVENCNKKLLQFFRREKSSNIHVFDLVKVDLYNLRKLFSQKKLLIIIKPITLLYLEKCVTKNCYKLLRWRKL